MLSQYICSLLLKILLVKRNCLIKTGDFLLLVIIYIPLDRNSRQLIFSIIAVVLIVIKRFTRLVNVNLNFSYITVFLKIRNIISKNRRSKVTYFAALIFCGILKVHSSKVQFLTEIQHAMIIFALYDINFLILLKRKMD